MGFQGMIAPAARITTHYRLIIHVRIIVLLSMTYVYILWTTWLTVPAVHGVKTAQI
jgi:hypothetical protein